MLQITPQYKHSKFGQLMFNLCAHWTQFMVKHRILYYILSCTWGILLTLLGLLITLVLAIAKLFGINIIFEHYYWVYNIKVGPELWGGMETGLMFIRDHESCEALNAHEFGHTFQNTLFGFIQIIWSLCSACWYWYTTILHYLGKDVPEYDSFWLEDAASQCGEYAVNYFKSKA